MAIYEYISGRLAELTPAIAVVDQGGIGYLIQISLQTYATLRGKEQVILLTEEVIREDSHTLFGFALKDTSTPSPEAAAWSSPSRSPASSGSPPGSTRSGTGLDFDLCH